MVGKVLSVVGKVLSVVVMLRHVCIVAVITARSHRNIPLDIFLWELCDETVIDGDKVPRGFTVQVREGGFEETSRSRGVSAVFSLVAAIGEGNCVSVGSASGEDGVKEARGGAVRAGARDCRDVCGSVAPGGWNDRETWFVETTSSRPSRSIVTV